MLKRILLGLLALIVLALGGGAGFLYHLHRRALPVIEGTVAAPGLAHPVEILRDRWGTPHIFAATLEDAAYAQGWATAQDRLFQIELLRRVTQGRLAELVGPAALDLDKLNRTLDLHGEGQRMLARAKPATQALVAAYTRGVNAYAASLGGALPPEFALLRTRFAPLAPDDLTGLLPFMAYNLLDAWRSEPLQERLAQKLGPERFARLFPDAAGAPVGAYPAAAASLRPDLLLAGAAAAARLGLDPGQAVSNNWVVAPRKSASGAAILANDPHLGLALPPTWHRVHLSTPDGDVAGVTLPGLPGVGIGRNRHIAWGLTNLSADTGDFFIEKLDPARPGQVMHRGAWVPLRERIETIAVKGGPPVMLVVRSTPHGPLVNELMPGQREALSFRWAVAAATDANDLDAFMAIDRAHDWTEFRAALSQMGGIAQNFAYADRQGNIGMQAAGRIPLRKGNPYGTRFRQGWDGSQEWTGFVPFARMPMSYNPPQGWLASANTSPFARPGPFYLSSTFEPRDRWMRIRDVLSAKAQLSVADMRALQFDTVWLGGRDLAAKILAAYETEPPADATEQAALKLLQGWQGEMGTGSPAAALVAAFMPALFEQVYGDELGPELTQQAQAAGNLQWVLLRQVLEGDTAWLDRVDTPQREGWPDVVRPAFSRAVAALKQSLGVAPDAWHWGALHTFEATHPLGRVKLLAPYFNRGPYPAPGGSMTVFKMQYPQGTYRVNLGPSMRQIVDFGDFDNARTVLPGGESGIPASRHYDDELAPWLAGQDVPLPIGRAAVEQALEGRLVLQPAAR